MIQAKLSGSCTESGRLISHSCGGIRCFDPRIFFSCCQALKLYQPTISYWRHWRLHSTLHVSNLLAKWTLKGQLTLAAACRLGFSIFRNEHMSSLGVCCLLECLNSQSSWHDITWWFPPNESDIGSLSDYFPAWRKVVWAWDWGGGGGGGA